MARAVRVEFAGAVYQYDGAWGSPGGDREGRRGSRKPLCARWLKPAFGTVFGLERRVDWRHPRVAGTTFPEDDGKPKLAVHSSLRRGWFFGSERFREQLLRMLAKRPARIEKANGDHGAQFNDYAERRARRLMRAALEHFGTDLATLRRAPKGDWRKGLLAALIQKETTMRLDWISKQLNTGTRAGTSRLATETRRRLATERGLRRQAEAISKIAILNG